MAFVDDLELGVYEDDVLQTYEGNVEKPCVLLTNLLSKRQAIYIAEHFRGEEPLYIVKDNVPVCVGGIDLNLESMMRLRMLAPGMGVTRMDETGEVEEFNLESGEDFERVLLARG